MNAMSIKPIETRYNGYRFRSRLEARWAVFFDAVGMPYEYEPEGFVLDDGTTYLPDFYLPWFNAYVEIKRKNLSDDELECARDKCFSLFCDHNVITLLCKGDPLDMDMEICCDCYDRSIDHDVPWTDVAIFMEGTYWHGLDDEGKHAIYGNGKHRISIAVGKNTDRDVAVFPYKDVFALSSLYEYRSTLQGCRLKSRMARFEHGETPINTGVDYGRS